MNNALVKATYGVITEDLERMPLPSPELPGAYKQFRPVREAFIDNQFMAAHGFSGNTADGLRKIGRVTGFAREYGNPLAANALSPGVDIAAATVAHLFDDEGGVARWMSDVFIKQFVERIGSEYDSGRKLLSAEPYQPDGLTDLTAGLLAVEQGPIGIVTSTVLDFRIGRILGVAYVVSLGKEGRKSAVQELAALLEKRIVKVVLGAS